MVLVSGEMIVLMCFSIVLQDLGITSIVIFYISVLASPGYNATETVKLSSFFSAVAKTSTEHKRLQKVERSGIFYLTSLMCFLYCL